MKEMGFEKIIFDKGNTLTKDYDPLSSLVPSFINQEEFDAFKTACDVFGKENIIITQNVP